MSGGLRAMPLPPPMEEEKPGKIKSKSRAEVLLELLKSKFSDEQPAQPQPEVTKPVTQELQKQPQVQPTPPPQQQGPDLDKLITNKAPAGSDPNVFLKNSGGESHIFFRNPKTNKVEEFTAITDLSKYPEVHDKLVNMLRFKQIFSKKAFEDQAFGEKHRESTIPWSEDLARAIGMKF
jgi:hypothetical protein